MRSHPYLEFGGPIAFAHRGGALEAPENTMRAFEHAASLGYSYIETDAVATKDGALLAFHDDRLDRVTEARGVIGDLDYDTVSRARVNGTEPIPKLADVLTAWPELRVNIDVKTDEAVAPMIAAIRDLKCLDRICVGSFEGRRMRAFRKEFGKKLCTSFGPAEVLRLRIAGYGFPSGPIGANCAQVPEVWPVGGRNLRIVDAAFLGAAHARGIQVHVWTVDERADMERLLELGVDGLMTDRPTLLKDVLEERAQWVSEDFLTQDKAASL